VGLVTDLTKSHVLCKVCSVSSGCSCRLHIFGVTSEHSRPFCEPPYLHRYEERYILMPSTTFDTLARPVLVRSATFDALDTPLLPEEVMYLNRFSFFIWVECFFQSTVIKQRSSTYKSSGRLFNQTDDRIQGEYQSLRT
jgi:hypothetical protein